jgi:hypothetical protein
MAEVGKQTVSRRKHNTGKDPTIGEEERNLCIFWKISNMSGRRRVYASFVSSGEMDNANFEG